MKRKKYNKTSNPIEILEEEYENLELFENNFDAETRTVFLFQDIDNCSAIDCIKALYFLDKTEGEITLIINSEGGSTIDGWAIVDFILQMKNDVHGIIYGAAFSMASVILQACKLRSMTKHSSMMIHAGSIEVDTDTNSAILEAEYLKHDLQVTMDFYRTRAKVTPKKMKDLMSQDSYLYPADALKYGFIDKIV